MVCHNQFPFSDVFCMAGALIPSYCVGLPCCTTCTACGSPPEEEK
ncbi:hypothetical protein EIKCOROL_01650 [Eikenella corrodens ATCC 23834]|uniref:Uncharacterized protein n=1 Tax=Eikenella corrodens ATCC 23834 TaxID=546274 RepID=C0DW99_EIKCO|nr:hypothetical protein EIKCOROL_01650 [Eikenella corrodens ATCC 23834]